METVFIACSRNPSQKNDRIQLNYIHDTALNEVSSEWSHNGCRKCHDAQESERYVLQCVAVCCSVLQCVAVCCSVLQCVAVWWSVMQCVAVCCSVLQCVAVCCSVMQCVAVCQSVVVCCSVL